MARAKKNNKRLKQRRATFYEAVPMSYAPPAALPEVSEQLVAGAEAISHKWRSLVVVLVAKCRHIQWPSVADQLPRIRQAGDWLRVRTSTAGLAMTTAVIQSFRSASMAIRFSADAAYHYAPPMVDDLRAYARRLGRAITSRRARSIYLSLTATVALALVCVGAVSAASVVAVYSSDISSPSALLSKKKIGTTILDRNGVVLYEGYGAQANKEIPLSAVPMSLQNATLAAEDPTFYQHPGFSWRGTARAAFVDITHHGTVEGGSTLTQQLVKNALLTSTQTFQRKYQEILLAIALEHRYSKDQILNMYLNEIYYGEGSSGVEAASQTYFHKSAHELTIGESALLAGLPLGPSRFDPNVSPSDATGRRDFVLTRMAELGKITKSQAEAAKAQPIELAAAGAPKAAEGANPMMVYGKTIQIRAPHFVFYVLDQLRTQYGDDIVEQGGITVRTTLDLTKQAIAEQSVSSHINALADHHVTNGGLVSLEPSSGDILAMVGSVDYNAPGFGNVNVTLSELQPGSSFKPIAYATAFKKGWNGATHIDDSPLVLPGGDGSLYIPQNYDGKFHGNVTLRHALDNSLNIPAVKVLQFAGIPETLQTAHDMGITSLNDPSRYGLSLVLGGGEVRPLDMATVYATFANLGTKVEPRSILSVTDRHGKDITKHPTKPTVALDPRIAYMITNIISDNPARLPEFPLNGPLQLDRPAAAKTGTTNDFRDNWTIGYTPQLVTAVWVGNNDHSPMNNVDGITGAAPIWHDYMEGALAGAPALAFTQPPGVVVAKVCQSDGGLANAWDTGFDEVFMADAVPTKQCSSYNPGRPLAQAPSATLPAPSPTGESTGGPDTPSPQPFPIPKPTPPVRTPRSPVGF